MSHELLVDKLAEARAEIERLRALSVNNAHSWDAIVREGDELRAEIARLRALLREARHYVNDAGYDEDGETQTLSTALLTEIDAALKEPTP